MPFLFCILRFHRNYMEFYPISWKCDNEKNHTSLLILDEIELPVWKKKEEKFLIKFHSIFHN